MTLAVSIAHHLPSADVRALAAAAEAGVPALLHRAWDGCAGLLTGACRTSRSAVLATRDKRR